jgi:anaerobic selenocysteine-containing dehydrogenase
VPHRRPWISKGYAITKQQFEIPRRGRAKVIHVDPRFSHISAMADIWAPLRAGSDILFPGALTHYVLENEKFFEDM